MNGTINIELKFTDGKSNFAYELTKETTGDNAYVSETTEAVFFKIESMLNELNTGITTEDLEDAA